MIHEAVVVVKLLLETLTVAGAEQWWSVAVIPMVVEDLLVKDAVVEDLLVKDVVVEDLDLMLTVVAALQQVGLLLLVLLTTEVKLVVAEEINQTDPPSPMEHSRAKRYLATRLEDRNDPIYVQNLKPEAVYNLDPGLFHPYEKTNFKSNYRSLRKNIEGNHFYKVRTSLKAGMFWQHKRNRKGLQQHERVAVEETKEE